MSYEEDIERARQLRVERLTAPDGWLALVERHWLDQGDNLLSLGKVVLQGDVVEWNRRELRDGDRFEALGLAHDISKTPQGMSIRVKDPASPRRAGFKGIAFYPPDPAWRLEAVLDGEHIRVDIAGKPYRLRCFPVDGGSRLQLVIGDQTSGESTYGAGRFLVAAAPPPGSARVVLDFNLAFNPPCAFNPLAVCPVPPSENRIAARIEAGEKAYDDPPVEFPA